MIGVWREIKQGQGVQRTTSALLELKLDFPHECQDSLPWRSGAYSNKGHSMLCYGHFMKGQREVESALRKPLILLPWSFLATPVLGKWAVHSPEPSEAGCQAVITHRVPRAVHPRDSDGFLSALFMTYCITASWGEGKTGQAEKQQQQFLEIFVWGWMKENLSVVCAAAFKKHFELDLIFTWFSETWQIWLISL